MNSRFDSISVKFDEEYGLRHVVFRTCGVPEYPTALNSSYAVSDDPRLAWRGGADTIKLPLQYVYDRGRDLMIYEAESITLADGSAISENPNAKVLLRQFRKNISFPLPGVVDVTLDKGPVMTPPTQRAIPAQISIYLIGQTLANSEGFTVIPYQVKKWANFGATWIPSETLVATSEGGAARGYLSGENWVGINTTYKGADVENVVGWNHSNPYYSDFISDIAEGQIISCEISPFFYTANGKPLYIYQEVFLQYDFSNEDA